MLSTSEITGIHVHLCSQILEANYVVLNIIATVILLAERVNELNGVGNSVYRILVAVFGTVYDSATEKPLALEKGRSDIAGTESEK